MRYLGSLLRARKALLWGDNPRANLKIVTGGEEDEATFLTPVTSSDSPAARDALLVYIQALIDIDDAEYRERSTRPGRKLPKRGKG